MRTILFFLPVCILISACEKNPSDINDINTNDSIYFNDLNPDILITSTDRYEPDAYHFCNKTPIPSDSISHFSLDLNNDSILDFEFSVKRWKYVGNGSSFQLQPCLRYQNFRTTIRSLNDSNKICTKNGTLLANEYLYNDIISNNSTWSNSIGALYANSVENQYFYSPENIEYYLGVQIFKENRYYFGWILMNVSEDKLIIKEYGINHSKNLKIQAGQKE
jgi:hypothetical protein